MMAMMKNAVRLRWVQRLLMVMLVVVSAVAAEAFERQKLNFNADWLLAVGDVAEAGGADYDDRDWLPVTRCSLSSRESVRVPTST